MYFSNVLTAVELNAPGSYDSFKGFLHCFCGLNFSFKTNCHAEGASSYFERRGRGNIEFCEL
jgi:hypothetical protein